MADKTESVPRNGATREKVGVHEWRLQELEAGVKAIVGTLEEINGKIDNLPCPQHGADLQLIRSETKAAQELLASDAKTAKNTLDEAAATAVKVKAARDADLAEIAVVASATTRKILSDDAIVAREKIKSEAIDRRGQNHWLIERIMPMVYPAISAAGVYLFMKAQGG